MISYLAQHIDCEADVETLCAVRGVDVCLKNVLNYLLRRGITWKKVHNIYMLYYEVVGRGLAPGVSNMVTQEFSIRSALGGNQGGVR